MRTPDTVWHFLLPRGVYWQGRPICFNTNKETKGQNVELWSQRMKKKSIRISAVSACDLFHSNVKLGL